MLELTRPFGAPVRGFVSSLVTHTAATEPWQLEAYWRMRRQIFCEELRLFDGALEEHDALDAYATPIVALSHSAGTPDSVVGIVRIYAADGGTWFGGRLGVAPTYRKRPQVGSGLIACAVRSAVARGCERFLATVLASNEAYFTRHHFHAIGRMDLHGQPHVLMEADLA